MYIYLTAAQKSIPGDVAWHSGLILRMSWIAASQAVQASLRLKICNGTHLMGRELMCLSQLAAQVAGNRHTGETRLVRMWMFKHTAHLRLF